MQNVELEAASHFMACSALVLLALPGMVLFYGSKGHAGDRSRTASRLLVVAPILALQWMILGSVLVLEQRASLGSATSGVPTMGATALSAGGQGSASTLAYAVFQMVCALVAAAILMCAIRARIKTSATVAMVVLWSTLVYDPIAYWMSRGPGWPWSLGAIAQLVGSGSALVCARFLDDEAGHVAEETTAYSRSTVGGMALLFASGLAFTVGGTPLVVLLSAPARESIVLTAVGGGVAWIVSGWGWQRSRSSSLVGGAAAVVGLVVLSAAGGRLAPQTPVTVGFVAGSAYRGVPSGSSAATMAALLAITEVTSSGTVLPSSALAMALAIGAFCYASVHLGRRLRNCRGFNLFGLHLVGGAMGVLLGGLAATRSGDGTHGGTRQFALFVLACAVAAGYSAVATHVLLRLLKASMRLRVLEDETRRCVAEEVLGMLPPQTGG